MTEKNPVEMFNELVQMGYLIPANLEPTNLMTPTAYISVPTALVFVTPPVLVSQEKGGSANAKLGSRSKGNKKKKKKKTTQ